MDLTPFILPPVAVRLAAVLLAGFGVLILYRAWKAPVPRRASARLLVVVLGWGTIGLSLAAWGATTSIERGVAFGLLTVSLLALGVLGRSWLGASRRVRRDSPRRTEGAAASTVVDRKETRAPHPLRQLWAGLLLLPVSAASALAMSTALFTAQVGAGPVTAAQVTLALFVFPLLWGLLMALAAVDARLIRKTVTIVVPGFVSAVFVLTRVL